MDISNLKKIHNQIQELREKADKTDSKKETRAIDKEIETLEPKFIDELDSLLEEIPDEIELRIKVNKIVKFDTWDFKSLLEENLLIRSNLEDFDIIKELKTYINDDFDPIYDIDYKDVTVEFEDARYK